MKIILIMGLPGSGKTTLANELAPMLSAKRLNADEVRKEANDWDFSEEGRTRQAKRMADFAKKLKDDGNYVVADFICPTPEARNLFPADYIVWVDTIKEGRFDDTNKMFVKPEKFDCKVTTQDAKHWAPIILKEIKYYGSFRSNCRNKKYSLPEFIDKIIPLINHKAKKNLSYIWFR
jgi:adenylylsulfate kinase